MPQIVKGGKYLFGWSKVAPQGKIKIPPEAFDEYKLKLDENVIIFSGSKSSGGFGLSSVRILKTSVMKDFIDKNRALINYEIPEGEIIKFKNRKFCWLKIHDDRSILLPEQILNTFGIKKNSSVLSGRGSHLAIAFITKGPIFNEAIKHPEIRIFE